MKTHIIYVPGILDDIGHVQGTLVKLWRLRGVRSYTHSMPWVGEPDITAKQSRLHDLIEEVAALGQRVYLVGASAGASAVLNAYVDNRTKVDGVCLICPKVNNADNVGSKISKKNPSFIQSLDILEGNLAKLNKNDKSKIITFLSPRDGIVPHQDSKIPGVAENSLPPLRHNVAILYALTFGFSKILRELSRINHSA